MGSWIAPLAAALLAAACAGLELHFSKRKPLAWRRASGWLCLRLALDALAGFATFLFLDLLLNDADWFNRFPLNVLIPGLAGPGLLRAQLSILGTGDARIVGPADMFHKVQRLLDDQIDDIGAVEQSAWITIEVLPVLSSMSVGDLTQRARMYITSLDRLDDSEKAAIETFLFNIEAEEGTSDATKRQVIVQSLLDNRGHRLVKKWVQVD